ncbi:hypothetical protein ACWEIJ_39555 [Lentzea sp. NPDC004789]
MAAFLAQAVVEPRLAEPLRSGGPQMAAFVASFTPQIRPGGDAEQDAMAP